MIKQTLSIDEASRVCKIAKKEGRKEREAEIIELIKDSLIINVGCNDLSCNYGCYEKKRLLERLIKQIKKQKE